MAERLTFNHGVAVIAREQSARESAPPPPSRPLPPTAAPPEAIAYQLPVERGDLAYWGAFLFTALLFFRPQETVPALAPLHLPDVVAVTALLSMVVGRLVRGRPIVPLTPELAGIGAMAFVMLLTAPFSIWPGGAVRTFTDVYMKVALIFVLLTHSLRSPRLLRQFTWVIVLAMGYIAARGVFDYARGVNLLSGGRLHGTVEGLMGNPNDLAMNMVTFLPFAIVLALSGGRSLARPMAAGIALLMVATVVFTKSRAGLLGLAIMGIVLVLQARRIRPGVGIALVVAALATAPLLPSSFWARMSSIVNPEEDATGSRQARIDLMREAWQTFLERPLAGVGAGQFENYNPPGRLEPWREAHNVVLQVLVELGVFGGLALLYLLLCAVATLVWATRRFPAGGRRRRRRDPPDAAAWAERAFRPEEREWMRVHVVAVTAGFAGWITCAQFASLGYFWTFYFLLALIVAAREITVQRVDAARRALAPRFP